MTTDDNPNKLAPENLVMSDTDILKDEINKAGLKSSYSRWR